MSKLRTTLAPKIESLESQLIKSLRKVKLKTLLIDPRAEMKAQKEAGNTETLVEYDRIGQLAEQAKSIFLSNMDESEGRIVDDERADIFDLQLLQNYVDHNHGADLAASSVNIVSRYAIRGTKRLLKQK